MLDFPDYGKWHTTYIKLLEAEDKSKTVENLQPGDKIKCDLGGMEFTADIKVNIHFFSTINAPVLMKAVILGKFRDSVPVAGSAGLWASRRLP